MQTGIKTSEQLEAMREGGRKLAQIYKELKEYTKPGLSKNQINDWVDKKITECGAEATYKEPEVDFPGVICISVNDEIVHGVPNDYVLEVGDEVSYDLVITYKGMKVDSAFSMVVGCEPEGSLKHLLSVTEKSLYAGIRAIKGRGTYTGDIGNAVQTVLDNGRLGVIHELVGHGVGLEMHMPPDVPNYGRKKSGVLLEPGDTIAIEPMATLGSGRIIDNDPDGWTIRTRDGSMAAHFEHTVLITEHGAEIITKL